QQTPPMTSSRLGELLVVYLNLEGLFQLRFELQIFFKVFEGSEQLFDILITEVAVFAQGLADDGVQLRRRIESVTGQRLRLMLQDGRNPIGLGLAGKRRRAGNHLVEQDAQAEDVRSGIDVLPA